MSIVVILNLPEYGHMNATFPLVAELVLRGERVVYFATEPFRERVLASGAEYISYGDAESFRPPAHIGGLYSVMAFAMGLAERVLPELILQLRDIAPDYLLIDSLCVWGNLASQVLGIPAAMLASVFVPDDRAVAVEELVRSCYSHAPKEMLFAAIEALNTYLMTAQRIDRRFGTVSPNIVQFFANRQELNILFTSRDFHIAGEAFSDNYKFVGPSIVGPSIGTAVPPLPESADPRPVVYISMGTIFNELPEFYHACFEAFGGVAYRVIMTIGKTDPAVLGAVPDNFELYGFAPQATILSQTSLFITHGGMNSVSEALWYSVPLLVFPQHGDQHLVASRVQELGAGLILSPADIEPNRLRELAGRVLAEPGFRTGASRIAESFHTAGGAPRAAAGIMDWVRK